MRLERLRARALGAFTEVDIDLTGLPDGSVVAVVGPNGAGKSTLLELFPAALYRRCPTRGSLVGLATARDAFLHATVVNGHRWELRHTVDGYSGKSEAVVFDEAGQVATEDKSAKVSVFDAWGRQHLPSSEVLLAGPFLAQKSSGLLDMEKGDRKGVILRALGIEKLELKAKHARERAAEASRLAADLRDKLNGLTGSALSLADAARALDAAEAALSAARAARAQAELTVGQARDENAIVLEAERVLAAWQEATRSREAQLATVRERVADARRRAENNRDLIGQAEKVRADAARATALDAQIASAQGRASSSDLPGKVAAVRDARAENARAREALAEAERQVRVTALDDRALADFRARAPRLQEWRQAEADALALGVRLVAERAEVQQRRLVGADERISELRAALGEIASGVVADPAARARDAIAEDDKGVQAALSLPAELKRVDAELAKADERRHECRREIELCETSVERLQAYERHEAAKALVGERAAAVQRTLATLADAEAAEAKARREADALAAELRSAKAERDALGDVAGRLDKLNRAEERLAELAEKERLAADDEARLTMEIAALGPKPSVPSRTFDLASAEQALRAAIDAEAMRSTDVALAKQRKAHAEEAATKGRALEAELRAAEQTLSDWTFMAESLGRNGVQALAIDAAGPAITDLCNQLLHEAFGPRFTVRIDTTAPTSDGGEKEVFEITVLDTKTGREGPATSLCGGEGTIVGEAISWALTITACRRSGIEGATIVRDESGAALDPENRPRYVAMLRRAAQIAKAAMVLFVSHSEDMWELADARIEVRNGIARLA